MTLATDLSASLWNAIADEIRRQQSNREIYFVKVKKADAKKKLIWTEDFGDLAIPLVALSQSISYFDTVPVGDAVSGQPIGTQKQKREDKTQSNPVYRTEIVTPKKGDLVIVLDPWGARRFPFCIGTIQSKPGFWEEA